MVRFVVSGLDLHSVGFHSVIVPSPSGSISSPGGFLSHLLHKTGCLQYVRTGLYTAQAPAPANVSWLSLTDSSLSLQAR